MSASRRPPSRDPDPAGSGTSGSASATDGSTTAAKPDPASAFLVAPGIAAACGGVAADVVVLCTRPIDWIEVVTAPVFWSSCFALVGYPTAAILGVPIYLALPERLRGCVPVVVPLTGAIAAFPWVCLGRPWRSGAAELRPVVLIAFALGAVAGIAFLLVRRPRA